MLGTLKVGDTISADAETYFTQVRNVEGELILEVYGKNEEESRNRAWHVYSVYKLRSNTQRKSSP